MNSEQPVSPSKPSGILRILFVGDVFGKPGVEAVTSLLPGLLRAESADFCIVNGENADQGKGLSASIVRDLFHAGATVITGGNHSLFRDKIHDSYDTDPRLLRPLNLPDGTPGRGSGIFDINMGQSIAVISLIGRAMLAATDDPFRLGKAAVEEIRNEAPLVIVDFHAEATAEKLAFARYVDGLATAVVGTHTHVQTADEQVLDEGTAYITDVGMTGSHAGVIGLKTEHALHRFLYPMMGNKSGCAEGDVRMTGVVIDADARNGRAVGIRRFQLKMPG